jgi:hypothetical protein
MEPYVGSTRSVWRRSAAACFEVATPGTKPRDPNQQPRSERRLAEQVRRRNEPRMDAVDRDRRVVWEPVIQFDREGDVRQLRTGVRVE